MTFLKCQEQKYLMDTDLHLSSIFILFFLILKLEGIHLKALSIANPAVELHHVPVRQYLLKKIGAELTKELFEESVACNS